MEVTKYNFNRGIFGKKKNTKTTCTTVRANEEKDFVMQRSLALWFTILIKLVKLAEAIFTIK